MNRIVKFGKRSIGDGYPCFVIAEAGSNHNGNFRKALALIDVAAESGANAVKFQNFKAEKIYTPNAGRADYLKTNKSIFDIIKEAEMPEKWIPHLARHCQKRNILFLSTPFDEYSADLLEKYVPLFKIASYELTDFPLVKHIAKKNKPIVLSTGAADLKEVERCIAIIQETGNKRLILMQCTACYPAPLDSLNLRTIVTMKEKFKIPVGLSDHSRSCNVAPVVAVALGANCIEKHFTLSNSLPGPDHKFAVEPDELKRMVQRIRQAEQTLGSGEKNPVSAEKELRRFARRYIFSTRRIEKGEVFTIENTAVLRRGKAHAKLEPENYEFILGKRSKQRIKENSPIRKGDF